MSYAVSVQWGRGPHYFVSTDLPSEDRARMIAAVQMRALLARPSNRGARPVVRIWALLDEIPIVRPLAPRASQ